jgi:hypothetical protein
MLGRETALKQHVWEGAISTTATLPAGEELDMKGT